MLTRVMGSSMVALAVLAGCGYGENGTTTSVTIDANLPPMARGDLSNVIVVMAMGGGALPWLPAAFFEDPDNDILDLRYSVALSDPAVASAEVIVDSERHTSVILTSTARGMTAVTVTATDPGGLSAEQSFTLTVDDSEFTPLPGLLIGDNTIEISTLASGGGCTPPVANQEHATGYQFTVHSSKWQTRRESAAPWSDVVDTEVATGQLCTYTSQTPGEYRLVMDITIVFAQDQAPIRGRYRADNTFIVEDT